jgi:hypothetical protein
VICIGTGRPTTCEYVQQLTILAEPSGREVYGVGLPPFACWDCKFEFRRRHGCLSLLSRRVVRYRSLRRADHPSRGVLRECGVSECDREASIFRRPWPTSGCCASGGGGFKNFENAVQYVQSVRKEGSIQASWSVVLPSVPSRDQVCSNVCLWMCKVYLFVPICNKTENKLT